jgi:hypothetical protein
MSCQPVPSGPEPDLVSHTYTATDAPLLNPERGFFTPYQLPGYPGFSPVRATGNTLVHLNIRLDDWRESPIPQDVLGNLHTNFVDIRDAGLKAIIRFSYNEGPYPDSEPDASKEQILRHIEQLTLLLQQNADVIAWVEAGFIGAWGEWHTSTNGLDNLPDKKEILFALLRALPETRMVQVRYPANIIEMFPNPLDAAQARVAHHNDCFLSSETDVGTYERDGVNTIERDQKYLAELTRFTPMSGETCAPNPPRSECETAIQEMELLHFSAINEAYHKGILRSWDADAGGCMDEIVNRLGYRLSLTSAEFNEQVRPGGLLNVTVQIENTGFASLMNPRPLFVVLQQSKSIFLTKLELDPRTWQPGSSSFAAKIRLPSNMDEGHYNLALWLPDAAETLQQNPLYAVQFANEGVWDESTGYNILGKFNIDSSVTGSSKRVDFMQVEELISSAGSELQTSAPATPAELVSNVRISNDAESIFVSLDYARDEYNAFQLFVDTDHDPKTGYSINGIGAEALFEGHTWNIYDGSGSDWKWQPTEVSIYFQDTGNHANWIISRSLLRSSTFDIVLQLVDENWNAVFTTDRISYEIK